MSKTAEEFAGAQIFGAGVIDKAGDLTEDGKIYTKVYEVAAAEGVLTKLFYSYTILSNESFRQ